MARINIKDVAINSNLVTETDNLRIILCPFNCKGGDLQDILKKKAAVFNYSLQESKNKQNNFNPLIIYIVNPKLKDFITKQINIVMDFESELDIHIFKKSQSSNDTEYNYLDSCSINNKKSRKDGYKNSKKGVFTVKFDLENSDDKVPYVEEYKFQIHKMKCHKVKVPFTKVFFGLLPEENYDKMKIFYKEDINTYYEQVIEFTGKDEVLIEFEKEIKVYAGLYNDKLGYKEVLSGTFTPTDPTFGSFKLHSEDGDYDVEYEILSPEKLNLEPFSNKIMNAKAILDNIWSKNKPQETPQPIPDDKISSQLNKDINPLNSQEHDRINKFITEYYQEFLSNPDFQDKYIKELTHSQYPVMAYPVYPEPAYYYLKQISERFILPASGSMPDNSIALFVNNPAFVEAFLCGMNTEMGRELLWREYPTDSRGSYFRKFWDTEIKKDIKEELRSDRFFDILPIHKWELQEGDAGYMPHKTHKLGQNHTGGKDNLLIFAIKGELLKKYPETIIYLSKASLNGNKLLINPDAVKILPDLSAWLSEDTYIVGFPANLHELTGNPVTRDPGYFLTFMNRPGETRFESPRKDNAKKIVSNAAETAANLLVQPYMFGKHISQFLSGWENASQK